MPRMRLPLSLVLIALLPIGCGDPPPVRRAGPIDPTVYEIAADDVPTPGAFLRYAPPGPDGGGLDIAITDYESPEGLPPVSLVGVVHVADAPYFERVQQALDGYSVVLYEAVRPTDLDVVAWQAKAKEGLRALSGLQRQLASWFGFVFQLDALDYGRPNLVHADMTEEEFREAGGGAFLEQFASPAEEGAGDDSLPDAVQGTLSTVRAFGDLAFGKPNPLRSLARKMFAETMGTTDIGDALDMMPGLGELILDKRNDVAMAKFVEVLPDLTGPTAIFYGAAHMPDLEKRLLDLGYRRKGGRWLRAWALRAPL